ncbi:MAG: hypothetical protein ACSHX8_10820 [Opitutaceae bacterium]
MKFAQLTFLLMMTSCAHGFMVYSEAISGDLSHLISSPTPIGELNTGQNSIIGTINEGGIFNPDVFTFSVAPDHILTSLVFTLDSNEENHFLAMSDGTTLDAVAEYLLFASLVTNAQNGTNLLETESDGGNQSGSGYSLPLSSGDYSLWFQETSNSTIDYTFTFTTAVVPEPANSTLLLSCITCGAMLLTRRPRH